MCTRFTQLEGLTVGRVGWKHIAHLPKMLSQQVSDLEVWNPSDSAGNFPQEIHCFPPGEPIIRDGLRLAPFADLRKSLMSWQVVFAGLILLLRIRQWSAAG